MEFNIKELKKSGDGSDSSPLSFYEFHQSLNTPLSKSDSAHKSTIFTSKEEQINSNNENISNGIDNKQIILPKRENINNIKTKSKNHKEKIMLLLSQENEKSKIIKKESFTPVINIETHKNEKTERIDRYGTVINKKNKRKIKVTFIDQINNNNNNNNNNNKNKLVSVIKIESFKKYNIILGMPKEDYYLGNNKNISICKCCVIY